MSDAPGGPFLRHDFTRELPQGTLERFSASRYHSASQLLSMRLFYKLYDGVGRFEGEPFAAGSDHLVVLARRA